MNHIETIRKDAITLTKQETEVAKDLPWETGLAQMEDYIRWYLKQNPKPAPPAPDTETILRDIADGGPFWLTLVFDKKRTSVVAFPLPIIYEGFTKIALSTDSYRTGVNINKVVPDAVSILDLVYDAILPDVVLMSRNNQKFAKSAPIAIGRLRMDVNVQMEQSTFGGYLMWINAVKDQLNHPVAEKTP